MSSFNRIAVYGHRGWASSAILGALIPSGAPIKVLHRPASDTSLLPSSVVTIAVDVENRSALVEALQDVDIVISLVGHQHLGEQHAFIRAIPSTNVKLFVLSDLSYRLTTHQMKLPALKVKADVEQEARTAGVPFTVIWPGYMVESTLASPLLGIDYRGNRIVHSGDSEHEKLNLCSRSYVAAAYASIFARNPISELQNRTIKLSEFTATGAEIAQALEQKHGKPPRAIKHSMSQVIREIETRQEKGDWTALAFAYRQPWGAGQLDELMGTDIWEIQGYRKMSLREALVEGKMEAYKELPPAYAADLDRTFDLL